MSHSKSFCFVRFYFYTVVYFSILQTSFCQPFNQYQQPVADQWHPNQYQPNSNQYSNVANPQENFENQKPPYEFNEPNQAPAQSLQVPNQTAGYYEASARTLHGRRLGRMLDVYGNGDVGIALDKIAERFQNLLREAREKGNQVPPEQNGVSNQNWGGQSQNSYSGAGYTKQPWSPGYSKKPWSSWSSWSPYPGYSKKPWSSWSPYPGYSKKPWSPWTKKQWAPNADYSQKPWSAANAQNSWSPNVGYSYTKKAWSQYGSYSKKAWSPYSKKPWSPYSGYPKQDGNTAQPWDPYQNHQDNTPSAHEESPGMDVDDFAMDAGVTLPTATERRTRKSRKEKTTQDTNILVDENKHSELVDTENLVDFDAHETEGYTQSGETVDPNFIDLSIER